jgi:hypothetical protein
MLASDPHWSARRNWAYVYITTDINDAKAGQELFNKVYSGENTSASVNIDGGIFEVREPSVVSRINWVLI